MSPEVTFWYATVALVMLAMVGFELDRIARALENQERLTYWVMRVAAALEERDRNGRAL